MAIRRRSSLRHQIRATSQRVLLVVLMLPLMLSNFALAGEIRNDLPTRYQEVSLDDEPAPDVTADPADVPHPFRGRQLAMNEDDQYDEAAGAAQAIREDRQNPLPAAPETESEFDQAPLLQKPLVAVGNLAEGLTSGLHLPSFKDWQSLSLEQLATRYSRNPTVAQTMAAMDSGTHVMRNSARQVESQNANPHASKHGRCFMYVQIGLQQGGLAPDAELRANIALPPPQNTYAKNAGMALKKSKYGFVNLLDIPHFRSQIIDARGALSLPMGAVLVYDEAPGSRNPAGHIEMMTQSGFASDYVSGRNRTGMREVGGGRKLIGVYIRPDLIN